MQTSVPENAPLLTIFRSSPLPFDIMVSSLSSRLGSATGSYLRGLFVAALVLILPFGPTAEAQHFGRNKVVYDDFDFEKIKTEHFDVYYYPPMAPAAQDAARMAERWYGRISSVFQHELMERTPIILYADDTDFQQTNVIGGFIGEGTGGVTEGRRQRLIMPLTGSYDETNRILGHELVHVFQYDLWKQSPGFQLGALPLWLIEGTAEYLSQGRVDPHTAMWMRDAVRNDDVPTTRQLTREQFRYFPYRYGQALMAYVGGNWGDQTLGTLYRQAGFSGLEQAIPEVLGLTPKELSDAWAEALRSTYEPQMEGRDDPSEVGSQLLSRETTEGRMNLSPAISPDGRYVAFFSERGLFSVDLYVANAETGKVIRRLTKSGTSTHFDAVRFISSAGSWSPDGRRLAFVTFRKGNNQIAILNARTGRIENRYRVQSVGALNNPAWGPDGRRIAFSGNTGGVTDLYVLDTETGSVRQLTNDRHAALQPAWSPDGTRLAYVTDRGAGTDFSRLTFSEMRIGLADVTSGETQVLPLFDEARHLNPQFSPDGRSLYFIADPDGYSDIYRYHLGDEQLFRMTNLATGVSGITSLSPAFSVAQQAGRLVFSVYEGNGYNVQSLELDEVSGTPVKRALGPRTAVQLPPPMGNEPDLVATYLNDFSGLPDDLDVESEPYKPRLLLDYIGGQGGVGVGNAGGPSRFDTQVGGGIQVFWSDLMGNHTLGAGVQANGAAKDIGVGAGYLNRSGRVQWGGSVSHTPVQTGEWRVTREPVQIGNQVVSSTRIDQILQRTFIDQVAANAAYPLNQNQRVEGSLGYTRYTFDFEIETTRLIGGRIVDRDRTRSGLNSPPGLDVGTASVAFVGDYSFFGFVSPVDGRRYRLETATQYGDLTYQTVLADYREYIFADPVTFAFRGMHFGRYGGDAEDPRLTPLFLGNGQQVRGYSFFTFDPIECGASVRECPVFERLVGTRMATSSVEVRVPLLGSRQLGLINFPFLPTELVAFADGGTAWSSENPVNFKLARESNERIPVFSTGVSARVNMLGFAVVEFMGVFPFQRPDKGWHFDFQISPGW